jgi:nicotinamide mononucleotide transporter
MEGFLQQFLEGIIHTSPLEFIAVCAGIVSVWLSKKEHILLYPVGLVNTVIYIWLSLDAHLLGEASVNLYYTIVSVYGWMAWARKDEQRERILRIRHSSRREWMHQLVFFLCCYLVIWIALRAVRDSFAPGAIPWADALASASAYTGMWLMARKKVESWIWWMVTNFASVPLYYSKGFVFTSVYYFVLLFIAWFGWMEWSKKAVSEGK